MCFDPGISEWGNPHYGNIVNFRVSNVAWIERTQGTETSKYLQEEKSIEIVLVAASGRTIGQTSKFTCWGCRTLDGP